MVVASIADESSKGPILFSSCTFPGLFFSLYFRLYNVNVFLESISAVALKILLMMMGFELRISDSGGKRFANCGTTTAR